jgi:hypothetical protein
LKQLARWDSPFSVQKADFNNATRDSPKKLVVSPANCLAQWGVEEQHVLAIFPVQNNPQLRQKLPGFRAVLIDCVG